MAKKLIARDYAPTPDQIDASKHLFNAFDHSETEISAGWLVRYCQQRGSGWDPFTREDIELFYSIKFEDGFRFNRLISPDSVPVNAARRFAGEPTEDREVGGGWIIEDTSGRFHFTDDFVNRCHASRPVAAEVT